MNRFFDDSSMTVTNPNSQMKPKPEIVAMLHYERLKKKDVTCTVEVLEFDMKRHYCVVVIDVMIGTGVAKTPLFSPMTCKMRRADVTETWIGSSNTSSGLAREVDLGVYNAHMPCESIIATEGLLLGTELAVYLLLARVVNRVLVSREIVRT